jgi:hypothetical protein
MLQKPVAVFQSFSSALERLASTLAALVRSDADRAVPPASRGTLPVAYATGAGSNNDESKQRERQRVARPPAATAHHTMRPKLSRRQSSSEQALLEEIDDGRSDDHHSDSHSDGHDGHIKEADPGAAALTSTAARAPVFEPSAANPKRTRDPPNGGAHHRATAHYSLQHCEGAPTQPVLTTPVGRPVMTIEPTHTQPAPTNPRTHASDALWLEQRWESNERWLEEQRRCTSAFDTYPQPSSLSLACAAVALHAVAPSAPPPSSGIGRGLCTGAARSESQMVSSSGSGSGRLPMLTPSQRANRAYQHLAQSHLHAEDEA